MFKNSSKILILLALSSCAIFSDKESAGTFPVYGNYCGPDHPKKGTNPIPIDKTDLACKSHDKCYETNGYFNASCDEALIELLKINQPSTEVEKVARKAVIGYFRRAPKI